MTADAARPVLRFAPSPNGRLHLGHAYSVLLNRDLAARLGGKLLLRIEDIDLARCRPEFERAILDDLAWLGLVFDPPLRRQSEHFGDYRAAFARIAGRGLAYPCFCSRREIAAAAGEGRDPDGAPLYPGTCRALSEAERRRRIAAGEPHAFRLDMPAALAAPGACGLTIETFDRNGSSMRPADPGRWGDAVVVRKDVPTSYHLSVVVDDALQGITHVVRGRDLEAATDLHRLLQHLLGLPTPLYHHHALIEDPRGEKLAKSRGSETLVSLRAQGIGPESVRERLGFR